MAEFIGQNNQVINSKITSDFFGDIDVAKFQKQFSYLQNAKQEVLERAINDAVIEVDYMLMTTTKQFSDFNDFVSHHDLKKTVIQSLYERAVFNISMAHILSVEITTNDTKDASSRADNLAERVEQHNTSARQAISMLEIDKQIKVEVV